MVSKNQLQNNLLITKGKANFIVENFCRLHLNLVIQRNFFSSGTDPTCAPSDRLQQEYSITFVIFLPKVHSLNLIMRKQVISN